MAKRQRSSENKPSKQESFLYRLWQNNQSKEKNEEQEPEGDQKNAPLPSLNDALAKTTLESIFREWRGSKNQAYDPMSLLEKETPYEQELKGFLEELNLYAVSLTEKDSITTNACIKIKTTSDQMKAFLFLFPPHNEQITMDVLQNALRTAGIVYGIEEHILSEIINKELYFKIVEIAFGIPAVNGKDGELIEYLTSTIQSEAVQKTDGSTEYQNINSFVVKKGQVICKMVPPEEGKDGVNIFGAKIRGLRGKPVTPPQIPNTIFSADKTELVALIDGRLSCVNNKFVVEKQMVINGNVDISVGNLEFDGDIVVHGDVRDGFSVNATGSVLVYGMVENANVTAGGDIFIEKGMNGNVVGHLEAKGDIKSKYLENCTAHAGGCIYANNIICSDVYSDDRICVKEGKGVIIGGSCVAPNLIDAYGLGAKSHRQTLIVLGNTPNLLKKFEETENELKKIKEDLDTVLKDMSYLESLEQLTEERINILKSLRLKKPLLMMKERRTEKKIKELESKMMHVEKSHIHCQTLFPAVKIMIGNATTTIDKLHQNCDIFYANGQIQIGVLQSAF